MSHSNQPIDQFKHHFKVRIIGTVLENGSAPAKKWIIPTYLRDNDMFLGNLLGPKCLEMFIEMKDTDKRKILSYVENCGTEVCEILKCKVWEEENTPQKICLNNLRDNHPRLYQDVMAVYK